MALDFVMELISPENKDAIFNRGSLEFTYTLIKSKEPEIAQEINTILSNRPISTTQKTPENIHQQRFYVSLNSRQVRLIVEALLEVINRPHDEKTLGMNVLAKSLFEEWMKLATTMMLEITRNE